MTRFNEIQEKARQNPVIVPLPKLSRFYLDEFSIYSSVDGFLRDLYDPEYIFENDVIIDSDEIHPMLERIECEEKTVKPKLNDLVEWDSKDDHQRIANELLTQSEVKDYIVEKVSSEDLVIVVIVDGLSFEAIRERNIDVQPVFVNGISNTECGYRRVVYGTERKRGAQTSIYAELLKEKKFYDSVAFTYWSRGDEKLSTELHTSITDVHKISSFNEAIGSLREKEPLTGKTYVQITRMGLDQDSHNRKEKPNRESVISTIIEDLRNLNQVAGEISNRHRIFLTSDHGILWRSQLPSEPSVVCEDYPSHARYVEEARNLNGGITMLAQNGRMTGLGYPHLTRELKNTQWGVHGGFSYYESIIPLVELTGGETL